MYYQELFNHMSREHGLTLLRSEMHEIELIVARELESALVRIKKRGDDCACTFYGPCGCGDACAEIASEALNSMRSRSPSAGDELRAGGSLDQHE